MRMGNRAVGILLLAVSWTVATEGAPLPEERTLPTEPVGPSESEEVILYRQLDLWHHRRNRDRLQDVLERLRAASPEYYCRGLGRLGNNARLGLDPDRAAAWYRRAIRDCAGTGQVILGLAEITRTEPRLCPEAVEAVQDDLTAPLDRLPFAAAEDAGTPGELEYLGQVGGFTIRLVCGDGEIDRREQHGLGAFRGQYAC